MPFLQTMLPLFLEAEPSIWDSVKSMAFLPLILVVFYFLLIRPENKKKKQVAAMRNELMIGDEVTTIGGIAGVIVQIKDDAITIETSSDRSKIQITRWAILTKGHQTTDPR